MSGKNSVRCLSVTTRSKLRVCADKPFEQFVEHGLLLVKSNPVGGEHPLQASVALNHLDDLLKLLLLLIDAIVFGGDLK